MSDDSNVIEVARKSYETGYLFSMSASAETLWNLGGDYNMKMLGVWVEVNAAWKALYGFPVLYGDDLVYFGPKFESLTAAAEFAVAKIEGTGYYAAGCAVGKSVAEQSTALLATSKAGVYNFKVARQMATTMVATKFNV